MFRPNEIERCSMLLSPQMEALEMRIMDDIVRRLRINGTNGSAELCPIERFDGQPLMVELKLKKPAGGLPAGRQTLNLGAQGTKGNVDRYINQLRQFARIVRGEEQEPEDLCEHDLAVQRAILRMCGIAVK